jgi:hypothetical protein
MTADDPAARPSAREVARILRELPTTSPPAGTIVTDESSTRVRTKPMTVASIPPPEPAPVRSRRRGAAWLATPGMLAAVLIIAVLVWALPRGGSSTDSGEQTPTASPGPDRLRRDLQDLQTAVQP